MTLLRDFQDQFQRALLAGDTSILSELRDGAHAEREVLLGVYRSDYVDRLVKMLRRDHEVLHAYMGDERFEALARAYVAANPARDPLARNYARQLPQFLTMSRPYCEHAEIAEIGLIEKSLKDAFYSEEGPVLQLPDLAKLPPEAWARLRFEPHVSARRLELSTNAAAIWTALRNGKTAPAWTQCPQVTSILIWRQRDTALLRELSTEEAVIWDHAVRGMYFGATCDLIAAREKEGAPERAAAYLHSWVTTGLIESATLTD